MAGIILDLIIGALLALTVWLLAGSRRHTRPGRTVCRPPATASHAPSADNPSAKPPHGQ